MHDAILAERSGVPAAAIMTTQFVSAARLMARVLGMPAYPFVTIEHPISNVGDGGLEARARAALGEVAGLLMRG